MKALYDYTTSKWRYLVAQSRDKTTYRDIHGTALESRIFTAPQNTAEPYELDIAEIQTYLDMAIADPADSFDLFKALPEDKKPCLKKALTTLPKEQFTAFTSAAQTEKRTQPTQGAQEQPLRPQVVPEVIQPKAEPLNEPPKRIECSVVNLNLEPQWLHHSTEGMVYAGRYNKRLQLKQSPLHNPLKLRKESDRPQVLTQHIEQVVIPELKRGHGPRWDEWQRLANRVRKGHPVALGCFCAPKGCHCDAHAIVANGLAGGHPVEEIIQAVQASLPAKQANLLEVAT